MVASEWDRFIDTDIAYQAQLIHSINFGLWQYNIDNHKIWWSAGIYKLLGYEPGGFPAGYEYFAEHLLHPDDLPKVVSTLTECIACAEKFTIHMRLLNRQGHYCWYETSGKVWNDGHTRKIIGSLIDIHNIKEKEQQLLKDDFLLNETGKLAKVGGWELDAESLKLNWSKEIYDIFELPADYEPVLENVIDYFEPAYRNLVSASIKSAIDYCRNYDVELQLRTAKNNLKWVRAKGSPVTDEDGKCTILRGIFQDIDDIKRKETDLQASVDLLSDQNKRLQNFAYIVSHNLRSHTGNLQFMLDLYRSQVSETDRIEILQNIEAISKNLNSTIEHLNEIVNIQTQTDKERKNISFETVFKHTAAVLENNITAANAIIEADFSECPFINSIPAYIDSIFLNMLSNAIKYAYPGRPPRIFCKSFYKDGHTYLSFEDNGSGIDLEKYGSKLFGMYKTFHRNADSKGLGLFITRNQVEALGGKIDVESIVNAGTKFTIKLN